MRHDSTIFLHVGTLRSRHCQGGKEQDIPAKTSKKQNAGDEIMRDSEFARAVGF